MKQRLSVKAIDLFCGVGGATYGLRKAGISVMAGFDNDASCEYGYKHNNRGSAFINKDIATVEPKTDIMPYLIDADYTMIFASPPCQIFSKSANHMKKPDIPRDYKYTALTPLLRIVISVKPNIFMLENVPGIKSQTSYRKFTNNLADAGYFVYEQLLNAVDYEVPQQRIRLILVCVLNQMFNFQPPKSKPPITVKEIFSGLPRLSAGSVNGNNAYHRASKMSKLNIKRIHLSETNKSWKNWPLDLVPDAYQKFVDKKTNYFSSNYKRLDPDKPAPTITTKYMHIGCGQYGHPAEDRALSLHEGALLQSFPPNYRLFKTDRRIRNSTGARLIGNAVPPKMAQVFGKHLLDQLRAGALAH